MFPGASICHNSDVDVIIVFFYGMMTLEIMNILK